MLQDKEEKAEERKLKHVKLETELEERNNKKRESIKC